LFREEKEFILRFSLEAQFPEDYEGEEEGYLWLKEWETAMKPELLKMIFSSLRSHPHWEARVRNRGAATENEIEIVMLKNFSKAPDG
jgi:hypothetical protein